LPTVVGCRVTVVFVDRLSTVRERQKGAVDLSRPQSAGVVVAGRVEMRISHLFQGAVRRREEVDLNFWCPGATMNLFARRRNPV